MADAGFLQGRLQHSVRIFEATPTFKTTPAFGRETLYLTRQSISFRSGFLLRYAIEAGFLVLQAERGVPFSLSSVVLGTLQPKRGFHGTLGTMARSATTQRTREHIEVLSRGEVERTE